MIASQLEVQSISAAFLREAPWLFIESMVTENFNHCILRMLILL
jgi:hypothetical protein